MKWPMLLTISGLSSMLVTMLLDSVDPIVAVEMPITSIVTLAMPPLHFFTYSTLLGTELYQSFVMTKIAYQALPRSAFTTLQKHVFPVYFQSQTLLLGLVALTSPPYGPKSLFEDGTSAIALVVAGGTALLNLITYGPITQKFMIERIHQGMRRVYSCPSQQLTACSDS